LFCTKISQKAWKAYKFYLTTATLLACYLLHPKVNGTASEKENGVQNIFAKMGVQGKVLTIFGDSIGFGEW
jgi:hypothetical protein